MDKRPGKAAFRSYEKYPLDSRSRPIYNESKTSGEGYRMDASTIGIIGGADGPTAIFITGKPSAWEVLLLAAGIAAVVAGVVFLVRKHRKKK